MELIQNNKGGKKLCHDGYMYTKKSVSTTTKRWECARRKAFNCSGKIVTNLDVNETVSSIEHNRWTRRRNDRIHKITSFCCITY